MLKTLTAIFFLAATATSGTIASQALASARAAMHVNNAQTITMQARYADCFTGGPEACGAAQEARDLAAGSTH